MLAGSACVTLPRGDALGCVGRVSTETDLEHSQLVVGNGAVVRWSSLVCEEE
jgi:hypothetical protein